MRGIDMSSAYEKVAKCVEAIRAKTSFEPDVALVLGSGLGNYAENIKIEAEVSYSDIPGFPVSTVPGHAGKFIFGYVGDVKVVCMKGRIHFYEGYDIKDVVLPHRVMKMLGAKILFLTNASGGLGEGFGAGDLMLITDHVSMFAPNPLIGENIDEFGPRFPDMSNVYKKDLQDVIRAVAKENGIDLKEGVYAQLTGPSFGSYRCFSAVGFDLPAYRRPIRYIQRPEFLKSHLSYISGPVRSPVYAFIMNNNQFSVCRKMNIKFDTVTSGFYRFLKSQHGILRISS